LFSVSLRLEHGLHLLVLPRLITLSLLLVVEVALNLLAVVVLVGLEQELLYL
jgi:hypothetical protein